MSPADWLGILDVELKGRLGLHLKSPEILEWLLKHGYVQALSQKTFSKTISELRNDHACGTQFTGAKKQILQIIVEHVSGRSCACYFEFLAFRALKFFFPAGAIRRDEEHRPLGLYQCHRGSLAHKNMITMSAFLFYENTMKTERLHGYGTDETNTILRFKELRRIVPWKNGLPPRKPPKSSYQIFSGGLVFRDRQCFVAAGVSYETLCGIREADLTAKDILRMKFVYYIFDDDQNADVVRGVKAAVLRDQCDPTAPVVELTRIVKQEYVDWNNIAADSRVKIGVLPYDGDLAVYRNRLEPSLDPDFNMLRVSTLRDDD